MSVSNGNLCCLCNPLYVLGLGELRSAMLKATAHSNQCSYWQSSHSSARHHASLGSAFSCHSLTGLPLKVCNPHMFSGDHEEVTPFLGKVNRIIQFNTVSISTDNHKVIFLTLYLKDGIQLQLIIWDRFESFPSLLIPLGDRNQFTISRFSTVAMNKNLLKFVEYIFLSDKRWTRVWFLKYRYLSLVSEGVLTLF